MKRGGQLLSKEYGIKSGGAILKHLGEHIGNLMGSSLFHSYQLGRPICIP